MVQLAASLGRRIALRNADYVQHHRPATSARMGSNLVAWLRAIAACAFWQCRPRSIATRRLWRADGYLLSSSQGGRRIRWWNVGDGAGTARSPRHDLGST